MLSLLFLAATVSAHTIFHEALINGKSQGQLFGIRAPSANNPILDVSSSAITCNTGLNQPVSKDVIEIAPGDKVGTQWNHLINGPQGNGDSDDPIASSHKGPISIYMAKVSDAAASDLSGLKFFKIAEQGLDTSSGKWAVDDLIANKGLWSFTLPSLASGDYILRAELIGLHEANRQGGAQFYVSCANVRVTGSGTCSPSDTISLPGAYSASDPGILVPGIYGSSGKPDNGGKAYTPPGPRPITCSGSGSASGGNGNGASSALPSTTGVKVVTTSRAAGSSTNTRSVLSSTFATVTTSKAVGAITTTTTIAPSAGPSTTRPTSVTKSSGNGPLPPVNTSAPKPPTGSGPTPSSTGPTTPTQSGVPGVINGKKFMCYEVTD